MLFWPTNREFSGSVQWIMSGGKATVSEWSIVDEFNADWTQAEGRNDWIVDEGLATGLQRRTGFLEN